MRDFFFASFFVFNVVLFLLKETAPLLLPLFVSRATQLLPVRKGKFLP